MKKLVILFVLILIGCSPVTFTKLIVTDEFGDPVSSAAILSQGDLLKRTNSKGECTIRIQKNQSTVVAIQKRGYSCEIALLYGEKVREISLPKKKTVQMVGEILFIDKQTFYPDNTSMERYRTGHEINIINDNDAVARLLEDVDGMNSKVLGTLSKNCKGEFEIFIESVDYIYK